MVGHVAHVDDGERSFERNQSDFGDDKDDGDDRIARDATCPRCNGRVIRGLLAVIAVSAATSRDPRRPTCLRRTGDSSCSSWSTSLYPFADDVTDLASSRPGGQIVARI